MIARRHVFCIGGYDPIAPEQQLQRLRRSLASFGRLWNVRSQTSALASCTTVSASWRVEAQGPNWKTDVTFEMLRWDDLVLRDSERGMWSRLYHAGIAFFDFVVSGAVMRYIRANPRYAAFFLFPYLCIGLFLVASAVVARMSIRLTGLDGGYAAMAWIVVAAAIFAVVMKWLGPHYRINHVLDDAIFSRQFLHGRRPEMDGRIDGFARAIVARAGQADVDEILVVGHSLGAAMAIAAVARALKQDPQLARHGSALGIVTVGATIPKFSLHPRGEGFRRAAQTVADEADIRWTEYQAREDAVSFYRFDPVALTRISLDRSDGRPNIRRVQIHSMMDPASFRRHRFNFMRLHYQFLMGNDRRSPYDYCMIVCGPLPFDEITSPTGAVGRFRDDGSVQCPAVAP